jgi:hypothetical protein
MPNPLQVAGAQPPRPSRKSALYQGARWTTGLWSNRAAIRDAASTRLEEKFYGPRGDAFLGGENLELSQRLTVVRRPGNSVWNSNTWSNINGFYEFRLFNANTEQIKTMVDTKSALYDASNNGQIDIWNKSPYSGQSYMQSVGNVLFWGDGANQKKWVNTLQTRIPYSTVLQEIAVANGNLYAVLNPYNFTPYELNSFIIDPNGNVEQLIGTVVQLSSFYIYNSTFVFTMRATDVNSNPLPTASQVLQSGLQLYFSGDSLVTQVLGSTSVTLTIENIVGPINTASLYFGGQGYTVGEIVSLSQTTPAGSMNGQVKVTSVGTSAGAGYINGSNVSTTTSGIGVNCTLNITTSGGSLTGATVAVGGTGYAVGDFIFPEETSGSGGYFQVATVSISAVTGVTLCTGVATAIAIQVAGQGYYSATNIPTTATSGTGLAVNIVSSGTQFSAEVPNTYAGGPLTSASVAASGTGYSVGEAIYPVVPVGSPASGAVFLVESINGIPATIGLVYQGISFTGYTAASGLATTTSGTGTLATFNILTVSGGQIATFSLGSGGTGYNVGDLVYPTQVSGAGASYTVSTVSGTTITGLTVHNAGYLPYTVASGVSTTTNGTGTGATVNITGVLVGGITAGTLGTAGTGYAIGDRLFPTQSGTSGTAQFRVASLTGSTGGVATIQITDVGTGYSTENGVATTAGISGTGCTVNIVALGSSYYPPTTDLEIPTVNSGGNPISSYTANNAVQWPLTEGTTTIDGSALWINRGSSVDGGIVWNWGMAGGSTAPNVIVNNAVSGWKANTYYNRWQFIIITVSGSKYLQQLVDSGVSGGTAPWTTSSTIVGQITTDGTAKWKCLSNDSDTTLTWAAHTIYSSGHIIEDTPGSTNCVYQLQPYTGIMTQGSNFPVYYWQCNSQKNSDVGAAGELPNGPPGSTFNTPMSQNGTQPVSTATGSGTMSSFFLSAQGGTNAVEVGVFSYGDGTLSGTLSTLFPSAMENLSIAMLPVFIIPAPGTYTFTFGHQVAMFWGIGNGSISLNVTNITVNNNEVTVQCDRTLASLVSVGVQLTFAGLSNATFLNGETVSIDSVSGMTFTAPLNHSNYGPAADVGTADSGATLVPSAIGPMTWNNSGNPNTYNFSTGTPIKGYKIMSANYPSSGLSIASSIVQVTFPAAGVYPAEIQYGVWYHSTSGETLPTTSPALPFANNTISFYMVYSPPGSTINYNVIPAGIACTGGTSPTFPDWPSTLSALQTDSPAYPTVIEPSGNYTWWNIGPVSTFGWTADVNQTTQPFVVDQNSNEEIAYEAGISGTAEPTFSTTLYGLTADVPNLVWMNNGPIGVTPTGSLTTTQGGWSYAVALVNTLDDTVSNASLVSPATGSFFEASGVFISGGLPQVIDPQADYVAIFRTDDGGATYYLIPPPASGNGNTEYTVPLSQYLAQGFTDTTLDSGLDTLLEAPLALQNSLPPKSSINLAFQDNRLFVSVDNTVFWSTGPDTPIGNGYNGFAPNNYAEFPSLVKRMVPLNVGMLIFTVSDIYVISGNGTAQEPFTSEPLIQRVGLLSYNALTVNGSIMYFMTTDRQTVELNVHSGISQVGFPIADLLQQFDPSASYLTWHVNGSNDQCLFVADGSTGWYRLSPTAPPENISMTWSLKANIVEGCGAIQSVETTPGNIQLLIAPPPTYSGPILYRDYTNWEDNGSTYPANFILGSLVLAYPGQVAAAEFITTDCVRIQGSHPISLGVRIGEIAGPFDDLVFWTNDPAQLPPSDSLYNQRFYMSQTKQSILCRHMQIMGVFDETNSQDELFTLTIFGGFQVEL